jgi:DUF1365 family protein
MSDAAATPLCSAIYEGSVRHRRHLPRAHEFQYDMAQVYLDLDELDRVFRGRWLWSSGRRNVAEFRRRDHLGPHDVPLADAVRARIRAVGGVPAQGPIRVLTHLRYFGHVFNPVTFYYCFEADGTTLCHVVAEITNTPWKERHAYVLSMADAGRRGRAWYWDFGKAFHVSPFMAMDRDYRWTFTAPGEDLHVQMDVLRGGDREFDATLSLQRHPLDGAALARVLWRYPLMTAQVVGAIHWQALRLWLKQTPVHDHPVRLEAP